MFKRLFGKKKERDLFVELFPLNNENKLAIESEVRKIQKTMYSEEGFENLINSKREYDINIINFGSLKIDTLGWQRQDVDESTELYQNEFGDFITLDKASPNGKLDKNAPSELNVYRNWIRQRFLDVDGGLISCDEYTTDSEIEAYESISKIPRGKDLTGMDYIYFLNIRNYKEQLLYQIHIKVHEGNMTGMRDNIFMQPFAKVANLDLEQLFHKFRKDPYDKNFKGGNRRNISEMSEFDYLFPFHPLSIIRDQIRPKILSSISFQD